MHEGKVVLVTGAGSGIGRATSLRFGAEGATVCIIELNPDSAQETCRLLSDQGSASKILLTDVTDETQVANTVENCLQAFGRIDVLFNNAGILGGDPYTLLHEMELATWRRVIDTNVTSMFLFAKHVIPPMLREGAGVIVNTASVAGVVGRPTNAPYVASKHAVVGLTRHIALRYGQDGIRANCIAPGTVDTPLVQGAQGKSLHGKTPLAGSAAMSPLKRLAQPEEIADAVLYLSSERAGFVNGSCLVIDGGFTAG